MAESQSHNSDPLFPVLGVFHDETPHDAALNMAWDDALLRLAEDGGEPLLRWYQWERPAVSIGYFQQAEPVRERYPGRDLVRRRTGGGTVLHGPAEEDGFTVTLAVPAKVARATGLANLRESYCKIHRALAAALRKLGVEARMVSCSAHDGARPGECFAEPVSGDVSLPNGRKIAGAAQSRSRGSLLHQQIIQLPLIEFELVEAAIVEEFIRQLAQSSEPLRPENVQRLEQEAPEIAQKTYGTEDWNSKR